MKKQLKCDICKKGHLTLLHSLSNNSNALVTRSEEDPGQQTILPTAIISMIDYLGEGNSIRCLIDLCAERTYVSEMLVQRLRLKKIPTSVQIFGINGITDCAKYTAQMKFKLPGGEIIEVDALVVPRIIGSTQLTIDYPGLELQHLDLADPIPRARGFIGALLGSDIAASIFKPNVPNRITTDGMLLQPTKLGWIVSGKVQTVKSITSSFITVTESLNRLEKDQELSRKILDFYELPDLENTENDEFCENLYQEKHYRLPNGRYVVPTPWKQEKPDLGHSFRHAFKMFKSQEVRCWQRNQRHYDLSNTFMVEYEQFGHMSRLPAEQERSDSQEVYYIPLPYHSNLKEGALTTKLRNVFNASAPYPVMVYP